MNKQRGKLLTTMIILGILLTLEVLYLNANTEQYPSLRINDPAWAKPYEFIDIVVSLIIFVGLWLWKKWAVYLSIISSVLAFIVYFFIFEYVEGDFLLYNVTIFFTALWFWAIYRKWKYFK